MLNIILNFLFSWLIIFLVSILVSILLAAYGVVPADIPFKLISMMLGGLVAGGIVLFIERIICGIYIS